jgi:hypothetical protein
MPVDVWAIDTLNLSGREVRLIESSTVMADGTVLGSRSGVRPGDPGLTVSLAGSTINVSPGVAVVYQPAQGVYKLALGSTTSPGTLQAAHATLSRIDLVYLRVWDNAVDASGLLQGDVVYLPGTASSTPTAPTPAGTQIYLPLGTITVPPSGGGAATVSTAVRPYTVAPGGILPSSTAPTSPYVGQFYDNGTDLLRWNGSAWDTYQKVPGTWTSYTPTWTASTTNPTLGNGTLIGRYQKTGRTVVCHINLVTGSSTTYGSGNYSFALPVAAANVGASYIGGAHLLGNDRWVGQVVVSPGATTTSPFFPISATNTRTDFQTPTRPEAFANGSQLRMTFTYEAAA